MSAKIPVKNIDPSSKNDAEVTTYDLYASREKIYVKAVTGVFQRIRTGSLWLLMGMYFVFCWVSINGEQLIYFDIPGRKFHLFGATFWPQDFVLLSWLLIICAFGLFFITSLFGRVWCGYTCPQTVWTFIFMWVEEKVEGSRNKRMKLDKAPNDASKTFKKVLKHSIWLLIAFATGLTFVGYFYPIRELIVDFFSFNFIGGWAYFWILFFTAATYANAGWLREQVCLYMCPYARFQSVMFDKDTMVVSYDPNRGEPRGSRKKSVDPKQTGLGDCVDCGLCVQVCPTGIDIRDGLQYECIGCALCIDACDQVMEKMNYPKGLIRYDNENTLEGKESHMVRPKSVGYGLVLLFMISSVIYAVYSRVPVALDVIKDRGALYQLTGMGLVENSYTLKVINMANTEREFEVRVSGIEGIKITTTTRFTANSGEVHSLPTSIEIDPANMTETKHDIEFEVIAVDDPTVKATSDSRFLAPLNY
ncbi:cytochrome c oxidase accessory protein CcoG [Alkalimarinus alittae]|uniref:Cytochrome c oxidase accessory protein CcoG n=1 Tax=Alkalimarinus alittae TaxID=2961619 RepID=A0ABY6MXU6_9ALTE|nr:cytochrome c oxidase accessory protein CcoG [Alkalimarinus alittae]UZE94649.1 cytochrome c oxidase accessory protein CcoG [Alkalimarinus alittae]